MALSNCISNWPDFRVVVNFWYVLNKIVDNMLLPVNNIEQWLTNPMSGVLLGDFQLSTISGEFVIKQFMNGLINSDFNFFSYQFPYCLIAWRCIVMLLWKVWHRIYLWRPSVESPKVVRNFSLPKA